jgi:methyl-accepting chemotaxis protein
VRTLSQFSRAIGVAAVIAAAALILGGAYFVGYVSELQRTVNGPAAQPAGITTQIAAIEGALGYAGFLKTYRGYRTTGDDAARIQLTQQTLAAERALSALRALYKNDPAAQSVLKEVASIGESFAQAAEATPEASENPLRGTARDLAPGVELPQLEASYLSLKTALARLQSAELSRNAGNVAYALNWSQILIIAAVATLAIGLLIVAGLLQLGIIHPLKSLERSLAAVGDGAVAHKVWGTERTDEFGAVARAGEKIRRSLTETTALKALADKGQLHISLDGQSSLLLQRLASEVTNATDALKRAAADFAKLQDGNRRQFEGALTELGASTAIVADTATALRQSAGAAVDDVRIAANKLADRTTRFDRIATTYERSHVRIDDAVATFKDRTETAAENVAASAAALKCAADGVSEMQTMLTASHETVALTAARTTTKVQTLAARMSDTIGLVDERLSRKLAALDALEQAVTANLATLRAKAEEAAEAMAKAAVGTDQQSAAPESQDLAAAIARLDQIAERLATPPPQPAADLSTLAAALNGQLEAVRSEIRELAVRMTEERILAAGTADSGLVLGTDPHSIAQAPQKTLADVPNNEIMARLKDLAAEMNAAQEETTDETAPLKSALGRFATEVKDLAASADRAARLKAMGRALDLHADEIEAHIPAVEPSGALRGELAAITGELRTIAARAQANGVQDGPRLREAAIEVGARAESLFTYLSETHPEPHDEPQPAKTDDIAALAKLIGRIESRADHSTDLTSNDAIHTVFESIGRLNNIANALARAGTASRRTAH